MNTTDILSPGKADDRVATRLRRLIGMETGRAAR